MPKSTVDSKREYSSKTKMNKRMHAGLVASSIKDGVECNDEGSPPDDTDGYSWPMAERRH